MKILVTGAAGFIGFHLCKKLINLGHDVIGLDNINNYYNVNLKKARLNELGINNISLNKIINSIKYPDNFKFIKINLEDPKKLDYLFKENKFDMVCNLAAQAGVRYSIENPMLYLESNVVGFLNLLECMRKYGVNNLFYASSSSVYGNSNKTPFEETDIVDKPISLYAATKKTNELMAYTYSHLFDINTTGFRFFTVYGPWGRPDMAMFLFTDAIIKGLPISVFNNGDLSRDFTYIDDIIDGIIQTIFKPIKANNNYQIFNIGNNKPIKVTKFIEAIEEVLGKKAIKVMLPMQAGDVNQTWASVEKLKKHVSYEPKYSVKEGVFHFVDWFIKYNNINLKR